MFINIVVLVWCIVMILFELIKDFINYFDSFECFSFEIKIFWREKVNVE